MSQLSLIYPTVHSCACSSAQLVAPLTTPIIAVGRTTEMLQLVQRRREDAGISSRLKKSEAYFSNARFPIAPFFSCCIYFGLLGSCSPTLFSPKLTANKLRKTRNLAKLHKRKMQFHRDAVNEATRPKQWILRTISAKLKYKSTFDE